LKPIKTKVTNQNLCQARIIPLGKRFVLEIVYTIEVKEELELNNNYLSIDLGVNNFATCYDSKNNKCFIMDGKVLKSYNQYWNKEKSRLQSILEIVNHKKKSSRLNQLTLKRTNKLNDYMNKTSKYILDYCKDNDITHIVIGHNKNWKQESNIGKVNNQKFVNIPHNRFIELLKYKCENYGIEFIETEESYTSKTDHSSLEEMKHLEERTGKRKYRGLFKQGNDKVINADLNGAIGILRKVIDESLFKEIVNRGFVINPNKINIYSVK
jgi:IS605 OrfB family transposase